MLDRLGGFLLQKNMQYAHEQLKIPRHLDRRVKVSEDMRERIKVMHKFERLAIREIARRVRISRRMIQFILFPERLERAKQLYKERRKDQRYYDREKHTIAMRVHRKYKHKIESQLQTGE